VPFRSRWTEKFWVGLHDGAIREMGEKLSRLLKTAHGKLGVSVELHGTTFTVVGIQKVDGSQTQMRREM